MSERAVDVVVVGAGIVGAACAAALAAEGLSVTVVEGRFIGGGATAAGMGHLVVMDDSEAQFQLTHYSRRLWDELAGELPSDVEFDRCGTIWVAADAAQVEAVDRKQQYYLERNVAAEALDARQLADAEPNLRDGLAGGLLVPGDAVIYPPCAARWLLEIAQGEGASLRVGVPVAEIGSDAVRLQNGDRVPARLVVVACGADAPRLIPDLPIRSRKGHLVITDRYPGFVRRQLIELGYLTSAHGSETESVAFNVQPRATGQLLIGSSRQFGDEEPTVRPAIVARMIDRAIEFLPGLARVTAIRTWTGFRAATDDKLPLVGPMPGRENVLLATGHEGLGITTSLGTARLLADHVLDRDSAIPRELYLPSRVFSGGAS